MKAIILAGGAGSRLYPITQIITKQLLPIYDKPMIYYPLSLVMLAGIREVLLVCSPTDVERFRALFGTGAHLGLRIEYTIQEHPNGLPEAFVLGEKFIAGEDVMLVLGDNLFYGDMTFLRRALERQAARGSSPRSLVFAYGVANPSAYGVVQFDPKTQAVLSIEEKPAQPKSDYAIPGLYLFDAGVSARAKKLQPSARGETEIVDLMKSYLSEDALEVQVISRGIAWLDTGTPLSLAQATDYIAAIEERQGMKVACLEEIALRMGYIDLVAFDKLIEKVPNSSYRGYLNKIRQEFSL